MVGREGGMHPDLQMHVVSTSTGLMERQGPTGVTERVFEPEQLQPAAFGSLVVEKSNPLVKAYSPESSQR